MGAQWAISAVEEAVPARTEPELQLVVCNGSEISEPPEDAIRQRSRQIWEQEGCPEGHAEEHWARARAELAEQLARMANTHLAEPEISEPSAAESEPVEEAPQTDEPICNPVMALALVTPPDEAEAPAEVSAAEAEDHAAVQDSDATPLSDAEIGSALPSIVEPLPDAIAPTPEATVPNDETPAQAWLQELEACPQHEAPAIICGGLILRGDLECPGDLHFEGSLDGSVRAPSLDVGAQASVAGDVVACALTVRGTVRGRVVADTVTLCAGARLEGEVHYRTLTIEPGAQFDGTTFRRLS